MDADLAIGLVGIGLLAAIVVLAIGRGGGKRRRRKADSADVGSYAYSDHRDSGPGDGSD